jgi:hypothetical protein
MAGELVPLVLIPRYTTFTGAHAFTTIAMEVTDYQKAIVNVWRGTLTGGGAYAISFEESTDQVRWTVCTSGGASDPGADAEAQYTPDITKRWFRCTLVLTSWAVGFLELRQS